MEKGILRGNASSVCNKFAEIAGRRIAFRSLGAGNPIILCNRFRGIMDCWDPAFLNALAKYYLVIIFDYAGVGLSSGELPGEIAEVATAIKYLAEYLGFKKFIVAGWSYGGYVAQIYSILYPETITHTVLLGTNPPGHNAHPTEQLFLDVSSKPTNDLADEMVLFFEPDSELSRRKAEMAHKRLAERTVDMDIPPDAAVQALYRKGSMDFKEDSLNAREKLARLQTPVLVIAADHDIVFPVQNWYDLTRNMPNLQIIMLPQAGHGPHHQYPELSAEYVNAFVRYSEM